VLVVKGQQSGPSLIGQPRPVDLSYRGKKIARGIRLWPISTGMAKSEFYGWLNLDRPTEESGDPHPPGYCHFPQMPEEFFKQLTAEQLITKVIKGYRHSEWVNTRERNEALDTRIYARAAAAQFGLDRMSPGHWAALEKQLAPPATEPSLDPPTVPIQPVAPIATRRNWLGERKTNWLR
jgi:phage terminase large subunit GpA-like protein